MQIFFPVAAQLNVKPVTRCLPILFEVTFYSMLIKITVFRTIKNSKMGCRREISVFCATIKRQIAQNSYFQAF
ncbi:hypothetical protein R70331_18080 [Paenibacillus sp. FSL R7-0331]|nr:hypothetical protein R70331_18080 [Paenibacillus sp. FSL R7-0331]